MVREVRHAHIAGLVLGGFLQSVNFPADVSAQTPLSKIAYQSNRDGNLNIYLANPDGTDETRLTSDQADDGSPSWSPDGMLIAFTSTRGGDQEIYVMEADRPEGPDNVPVALTNSVGENLWPDWSPDGTKIAFYSTRDGGNRDLYVMNANGSNQIRLTSDPAADRSPSWSPEGLRIAFSSERSGNREIWVAEINVLSNPPSLSNLQNLTNHTMTEDHPSWAPTGSQIAFISDRDFVSSYDVYVMNADGMSQTRLTVDSADDAVAINPWSPDGSRLIFHSTRSGSGDLYQVDSGGGVQVPVVTNAANDGAPSWSPILAPISQGFLVLPLDARCGAVLCTPYSAKVSAVLDHSVPTGFNCHRAGNCDGRVLSFNGEQGLAACGGSSCSNCPPPGYKNTGGSVFLSGVLKYVGVRCPGSYGKDAAQSPELFLNYDGHSGYDFPYAGVPILAAAAGILEIPAIDPVNNPTSSPSIFNSMRVLHPNGYQTWYLHASEGSECIAFRGYKCDKDSVERPTAGQQVAVQKGQVIGIVGNTGPKGTATHLHFEVRENISTAVDPYGESLWE